MKRLFCLILTLSLAAGLLSGCGGKQEPKGDVAMGRYIEEKGEVLEGITRTYSLHRDGTGNIVFYAEREDETIWRGVLPAGGGEAQYQEVAGLMEAVGEMRVSEVSEGPDGTLLVLCRQFETNQDLLLRSNGSGGFAQVTVSDWDTPTESGATGGNSVMATGGVSAAVSGEADVEAGDGFFFAENQKMAYGIMALKDGGFLLCYGEQGATQYDRDGAVVRVYPGQNYGNQIALWENKLLMSGGESGEFTIYDVDTGAQLSTATYENGNYFVKLGLDEQGLYLGDASGIYRQVENGDLWEKLVDGSLTTLAMPTIALDGLVSDGSGGFVGLLRSDDQIQVAHYVYSETTPTTPDTELTIFSLHDNNTVRQAIGEFQRQNPNVRVNFQIMMDETSGATAQDVINSLNTELLSGKGPDLLLLDGLPVDSYIEKGVLSDITDLVTGNGDLYQNLMNAYERAGKIYGVPTRFSFPAMAGVGTDLDRLTSLETLVALAQAEQGEEVPLLVPSSNLWDEEGSGMLMDYYGLCVGDWLSADGTIDQLSLSRYLTGVTDLEAVLKEHSPQNGGMTGVVVVSSTGSSIVEMVDMGFWYLTRGTGRVYLAELGSMMNVRDLMNTEDMELRSAFGSNKYTPRGGVGVVSTGKQQELARSFVETLLSGGVQDVSLADGLPVNQVSMNKMMAQNMEDSNLKRDLGLSALCGRLDTPILTDQVIRDTLEDQLRKMANGKLTPEQAAADLVDRVQIYLSE